MSVYQVEEYYIHIQFDEELSDDGKETLRQTIEDEGYDRYEITNDEVIVDGIESEQEGLSLEGKLVF